MGGGPAGAVAALVLARAGVRVRVLDRARFPRFKLCGDSVNPGALAILSRLGLGAVVEGALTVDGMIVTSATGARCAGRYGNGLQGRMISRHQLDDALLAAARAAGACVEEGVLVRGPVVDDGLVSGVEISAGRPDVPPARADGDCGRRRELAGGARAGPGGTCGRGRVDGPSARTSKGLPTSRAEQPAVRGVSARCTCDGTATSALHRYLAA